MKHLSNVFSALREASFKLKPSKCYFAQEVHYFGHDVCAAGVSPDKAKIAAVSSYPVPVDVKQLRQFLGLMNYYQRFVQNYSKIAEPLNKLLREGSTYKWETACQEAFAELKYQLVTHPILAYP